MRHTYVVVVLTCLLWPGAVLGQQPERFGESSRAAIEELFVRYNQAVSVKHYPGLRQELQAPFVTFLAGVQVLPTLDDVMEFYQTLRESFDQTYARSEMVDSRITALSADRAIVSNLFRRYRQDGTVLLEASGIYFVSRSSGAWKVFGIAGQDREAFGKVY